MAESVSEILHRHLEAVKEKIAQKMEEYGRNASGTSVESLRIEVDDDLGTLWGANSFLTMERGRGPGRVPANFKEIIRQWILDKGISVTPIPSVRQNTKYTPEERGLNSLAGAIAWHIMRNGTGLYQTGGYNDIYSSAIEEELKLLGDEITLWHSERLTQAIDETL